MAYQQEREHLRFWRNGRQFADDILKFIFLNGNDFVWYKCDSNVAELFLKGSVDSKIHFGLNNGLALNRWQATIWTNDGGLVYLRICLLLDRDEVTLVTLNVLISTRHLWCDIFMFYNSPQIRWCR